MLGIDIIDLSDPLLKERNNRTLELIKSSNDHLIEHSNIFWLLWSAKEAVFKCKREPLVFDPKSIAVTLKSEADQVSFQSGKIEGSIVQTAEYILAICSDKFSNLSFEVYKEENKSLTNQLRLHIDEFFKKHNLEIEIGSDDLNLPILLPSMEPISITHHGKFGAFAYPSSFLDR
jgi:hypothetical protein